MIRTKLSKGINGSEVYPLSDNNLAGILSYCKCQNILLRCRFRGVENSLCLELNKNIPFYFNDA